MRDYRSDMIKAIEKTEDINEMTEQLDKIDSIMTTILLIVIGVFLGYWWAYMVYGG